LLTFVVYECFSSIHLIAKEFNTSFNLLSEVILIIQIMEKENISKRSNCYLILEQYVQLLSVCYTYLRKYGWYTLLVCPPNCLISDNKFPAGNPQYFSTTKIQILGSHYVLDLLLPVCRQNGFCNCR
jgi:hypothetical protein